MNVIYDILQCIVPEHWPIQRLDHALAGTRAAPAAQVACAAARRPARPAAR